MQSYAFICMQLDLSIHKYVMNICTKAACNLLKILCRSIIFPALLFHYNGLLL